MKAKRIRKIVFNEWAKEGGILAGMPLVTYNYIPRNRIIYKLVLDKETGKEVEKAFNYQTKQIVVGAKCLRGVYKDMKRQQRGKSSRAFLLSQTQVSS